MAMINRPRLPFRPKTGEGAESDTGQREFNRCTKANHTVARCGPLSLGFFRIVLGARVVGCR